MREMRVCRNQPVERISGEDEVEVLLLGIRRIIGQELGDVAVVPVVAVDEVVEEAGVADLEGLVGPNIFAASKQSLVLFTVN